MITISWKSWQVYMKLSEMLGGLSILADKLYYPNGVSHEKLSEFYNEYKTALDKLKGEEKDES